MSQERLELVQLLARFKLGVRREFNASIDLARLEQDRAYATEWLKRIEDSTHNESLLVITLQLRGMLLNEKRALPAPEPPPPEPEKPTTLRSYVHGVRGF